MCRIKIIGATLLVAGTAIGGGMIALPVITGIYGFYSAVILMTITWLINTYIAFLLLEVNLWLPSGSSIISMAKSTLGQSGVVMAWISSLLFLYTLLVAYISGISEIFLEALNHLVNVLFPNGLIYCLLTALFACSIYQGTRVTDYANRICAGGMVISLLILLALLFPHIKIAPISYASFHSPLAALPVVFTSFGFMIVIPSIRHYLDSNIKELKLAIFIGSLIPLILYLIWEFFILRIIPIAGSQGLFAILQQGDPGTGLTTALNTIINNPLLTTAMRCFVFFAIATSLIGSSLGLFDLIADGLNIEKNSGGKIKATLLTFIPPLTLAIFFRKTFIEALGYAGVFSVVLLATLPAWMVWRGRAIYKNSSAFQLKGGRVALVVVILFSVLLIIIQLQHLTKFTL